MRRQDEPRTVCRINVLWIESYIKSFLGLIRNLEGKVSNIITIGLALVSGNGEISDESMSIVHYVRGFVAWTFLRVRCSLIVDCKS
jgi:hypothetical protein